MIDERDGKPIAAALRDALGEVENLTQRVRDLERQLTEQRHLIAEAWPVNAQILHKKQVMRNRRERALSFSFDHPQGQVASRPAIGPPIDTRLVTLRSTTVEDRRQRSMRFFEQFSALHGSILKD